MRVVGELVALQCVEGLAKGLNLTLLRRPACIVDRNFAADEMVGTLCVAAVFGQEPVWSTVGECNVGVEAGDWRQLRLHEKVEELIHGRVVLVRVEFAMATLYGS